MDILRHGKTYLLYVRKNPGVLTANTIHDSKTIIIEQVDKTATWFYPSKHDTLNHVGPTSEALPQHYPNIG